jgi:hypothetical protein
VLKDVAENGKLSARYFKRSADLLTLEVCGGA